MFHFNFLNWLSLNEGRDVELVILVKTYLLKVLLKEAFKSKLMDSRNSLRRILGGQTSLKFFQNKVENFVTSDLILGYLGWSQQNLFTDIKFSQSPKLSFEGRPIQIKWK